LGKSQEWVKSYLGDREQYVEIRTTVSKVVKSSNKKILSGVPQGSVLGPLLFTMYINDLPNFISSVVDIVMYPDDCALVISAENEAALESKLVQVVKLSSHWFKRNNLKNNLTKSFLMHIRTNHLTKNMWNLMLQEESVKDLTVINDVKFSGVYLDCHLSWNKHVNELVLKLKKDIFFMRK